MEHTSYNAFVVGNSNDSGNQLDGQSSRGPTPSGRKKPDVVAPGLDITSTSNLNGWWHEDGGTSYSCAHVAGAMLLYLDYIMGAGNSAETFKAILINTVNQPAGSGWNSGFGWGAINLTRAYQNRSYWRTLSVSQGQSVWYKGTMDPNDAAKNRATLVWQSHVSYNGANHPTGYLALSDIDLRLWDYTNNVKGQLITMSESYIDNIEQVQMSSWWPAGQVLVEVHGYWVNGGTEWVTLATPAGFTQVTNPAPARPDFAKETLRKHQGDILESSLHPNYPNPSNPETWIPYTLKEAADVVIEIYNVRGEVVRELKLGHKSPGWYLLDSGAAYFDGRNAAGDALASGVYFYHIKAGDFVATRSLVLRK